MAAEKFGLKRVKVYGQICIVIFTVSASLASSFEQLLFLRALHGLASTTFSPVAITYIGSVFPLEKRGTTLGVLSVGFLLAGIVGQLISDFIESRWNWQAVFSFFSVIYIVTFLLLLKLPPDLRKEDTDFLSIIKRFRIPFQQKTIIISYLISITILMTFVGMYTSLGELLEKKFDFSDKQIFFVRALGGIGILFSLLTGRLSSRFGIYRVVYYGFSLAIIGLLFMGISQNLVLTTVMSIIFVSGIATVVPTLLEIVGHLGRR